ncbi:MAG: c-type cytochrome [Albidovulum sp.]|nr:c-type cytochrome [Albidovulum sp.]
MARHLYALTVAALLWSAAAVAAERKGSILAASCFTCHGSGGVSPGEIPSIAELDAETLLAMLEAFRNGEAESTIMTRIAKGYSDAEIEALAVYLAAQD